MSLDRILKETWKGIRKHRVTDLAAMLTYYGLFALFPFMLFVVTLTLLVLPRGILDQAYKMMTIAMPGEIASLALDQLRRMEPAAGGGFAIVGGALALWGASRGAAALQTALNDIHEYDKTYGTLGGIIVFLTWLWLSCLALVIGAEIDNKIDELRRERGPRAARRPSSSTRRSSWRRERTVLRAASSPSAIWPGAWATT